MGRHPDFLIIGAMKAGTSTLHDQLAAHQGLFLSVPKEPCFFSDADVWARGLAWYEALFAAAAPDDLCGESSTHYTKRPQLPDSVGRIAETLPDVRLVYMMRHPIERLVSHYVHEWTEGTVREPLEAAVERHPELVDHGRYAYQLRPYLETFGRARILPVFLERHARHPREELARVLRFLGHPGPVNEAVLAQRSNVSSQRLRRSRPREFLQELPAATWLRRTLLPERVRERIKARWRISERPEVGDALRRALEARFDEDLAELGGWLGVPLSCARFREQVADRALEWAAP